MRGGSGDWEEAKRWGLKRKSSGNKDEDEDDAGARGDLRDFSAFSQRQGKRSRESCKRGETDEGILAVACRRVIDGDR